MGTTEGPTFHGAVLPAVDAVASGSTDVCLVVNSMLEAGGSFTKRAPSSTYAGDSQFTVPFGVHTGPHWISLLMRRHMAQYGTTEEHFAHQAIAQREFAVLNDEAIFRTPLTMEDYLSARYICKPCRLLDCDYPVDVGGAVIVTTEERARDLRQKPVFVESWAMGSPRVPDSTIMEDMTRPAPWVAGEIWGRTDDVAGENNAWMTAQEKCVQDRARTLIEMIHAAVRDSAWGESSRPLRFVSAHTTSVPCITRSTRNWVRHSRSSTSALIPSQLSRS